MVFISNDFLVMNIEKLNFDDKVIHIVGIGGICMSGIAKILYSRRFTIQGSNIENNSNVEYLVRLGIRIFIGHNVANIKDIDILIVSSAINDLNPELLSGIKNNVLIYSRAQIIQEIVKKYSSICITGAHGKTSTTALVFHMLENLEPSVLCGGILKNYNTNAVFGKTNIAIIEADESDSTVIQISTNIGIITNIDNEHLDFYTKMSDILYMFKLYIHSTIMRGLIVACIDCPYIQSMRELFDGRKHFLTYSLYNSDVDIYISNLQLRNNKAIFDLKISNKIAVFIGCGVFIKGFEIPFLAPHELSNILPSIFVALYYGYSVDYINNVILKYSGVKRRFIFIKKYNNITFIDDYGHHPREILNTLYKAKMLLPNNAKVIVVFEPHRYSRFQALYHEFVAVFRDASYLVVLDIYTSGDNNNNNVNVVQFIDDLSRGLKKKVFFYGTNIIKISHTIINIVKGKDVILFLGAGNISKIAYQIVEYICI